MIRLVEKDINKYFWRLFSITQAKFNKKNN
jgi:hypothetical protein